MMLFWVQFWKEYTKREEKYVILRYVQTFTMTSHIKLTSYFHTVLSQFIYTCFFSPKHVDDIAINSSLVQCLSVLLPWNCAKPIRLPVHHYIVHPPLTHLNLPLKEFWMQFYLSSLH